MTLACLERGSGVARADEGACALARRDASPEVAGTSRFTVALEFIRDGGLLPLPVGLARPGGVAKPLPGVPDRPAPNEGQAPPGGVARPPGLAVREESNTFSGLGDSWDRAELVLSACDPSAPQPMKPSGGGTNVR